jgi:haloalkane dehalogenase
LAGKVKLITWGMRDIAFREKELNRWVKQFPGAKVVRYTDAGHFLAEEKRAELIEELAGVFTRDT